MNNQVTEIAVRHVKPGRLEQFKTRRASFIGALKGQQGVLADREFQSFYAMPEPDKDDVYIGMTTYDSIQTNNRIQSNMGILFKFFPFMMTMTIKAYVYVQQIEGTAFDLKKLAAKPGQVLELAVRRVDDSKLDEFNKARKEFVALLSSQSGVLESYEFKVVKGTNIKGLTVGMSVYESQDAFQKVAGTIMQNPVTQKYFSTFTPVAVKYAMSTTNQ